MVDRPPKSLARRFQTYENGAFGARAVVALGLTPAKLNDDGDVEQVRPCMTDLTPWKFAEQHQIDPDESYRNAVYAEIRDGLIWLGLGGATALSLIVGMLYYGGAL